MSEKSPALDPITSESTTEAQATSHDRWFREQVQAAIDDPRPSVPHDKAMVRVSVAIQTAKRKSKST